MYRSGKQNICTNCGLDGHHYKSCTEPITSYGIIAFRIKDPSWNQPKRLINNEINGLPEDKIEYLLVQRRDSIGFIELLRAKYKITDLNYIRDQISGTTQKEREALLKKSFDELWTDLWGPTNFTTNKQYKQEYDQAKVKFEMLKVGVEIDGKVITLKDLIESTPILWQTPEWGFPKGRRNIFETDHKCAIREFCEETGLKQYQVHLFENLEPIRETFFGNNGIHYCHVYYLAWIPNNVEVSLLRENKNMMREIGGIGWFSLDVALANIRATNIEKREILLRVSSLLRNLAPVFVGPIVATAAAQAAQIEESPVNRNREDESKWSWKKPGVQKYSFIEEKD
jgi:8-oxo-dGTP pyrophosphatase MutT (NUDIX family)